MASSEQPNATSSASRGPVGQSGYVVRAGDCIESIAYKHGLFWETIWNHPNNQELRAANRDPNALLPGDRVFVPEIQSKKEAGETKLRHRFRRKGVPSKLRIAFKDEDDKPRAGIPYVLEIDGVLISGKTNDAGVVEHSISPDAKTGKLILKCEDGKEEYELKLGHIDPIDEVSGVKERLTNLGFECGPWDGEFGPVLEEAIRAFQKKYGLTITGELDEQTLQTLESEHSN